MAASRAMSGMRTDRLPVRYSVIAPLQLDGIAPSHIFLASDDAIGMTGQVFHPNGGEILGG
jgi:hypothetical protein